MLRLVSIWFGLPHLQTRPDEETAIGRAIAMRGGDLNPHFFHWPSLVFYVFAALLEAASWIRGLLFHDPSLTLNEQFVVSRAFVALAGTATIVVLFGLARRLADDTTALAASLFLSVAFLHVRDSHFAMTDIVMTLLLTLSLALLLRAHDIPAAAPPLPPRGVRGFAAAGLAGGLAASTKYSAAAVGVAMAASQVLLLMRWRAGWFRPQWWTPSAVFVVAFGCGFIAATFARDLKFDFQHLSVGHTLNTTPAWIYHATRSLPYGLGWPIFIAALAGIVPALRSCGARALPILAFAAVFYASIGSGRTVFFRYILPLVPLACLLAGIAVQQAAAWLASRLRVSTGVAAAALAAVVAAPAFVNAVWFDMLLARTDTRVLAGRWLTPLLKPEESLHQAPGSYTALYLPDARVHHWRFDSAINGFDAEGRIPPGWCLPNRRCLPMRTRRRRCESSPPAVTSWSPCFPRQRKGSLSVERDPLFTISMTPSSCRRADSRPSSVPARRFSFTEERDEHFSLRGTDAERDAATRAAERVVAVAAEAFSAGESVSAADVEMQTLGQPHEQTNLWLGHEEDARQPSSALPGRLNRAAPVA